MAVKFPAAAAATEEEEAEKVCNESTHLVRRPVQADRPSTGPAAR